MKNRGIWVGVFFSSQLFSMYQHLEVLNYSSQVVSLGYYYRGSDMNEYIQVKFPGKSKIRLLPLAKPVLTIAVEGYNVLNELPVAQIEYPIVIEEFKNFIVVSQAGRNRAHCLRRDYLRS